MMRSNFRQYVLVMGLVCASSCLYAGTTDSTAIKPLAVKTTMQKGTNLLAQGQIQTTIGNYNVYISPTNKRCPTATNPILMTSLKDVEYYGWGQAIEGVINNLAFNTTTYTIYGTVSAPVNIGGARDNGATVTWQIWCEPSETG